MRITKPDFIVDKINNQRKKSVNHKRTRKNSIQVQHPHDMHILTNLPATNVTPGRSRLRAGSAIHYTPGRSKLRPYQCVNMPSTLPRQEIVNVTSH
jgi:hypothetical protein